MPATSTSLRPVVSAGSRGNAKVLSVYLHDALKTMRVSNGLGTPAHARLSFLVSPDSPELGIEVGHDLQLTVDGLKSESGSDVDWELFAGVVVSLGIELGTGNTQIMVVEAYDQLFRLGRTSVAETFIEKSPSAIVEAIVGPLGLTAKVHRSFGSGMRLASYQYGTAYAYIDRLVRDEGCEWYVTGNDLHIRPRKEAGGSEVVLGVGENLKEFSARFSATDHVDKVTVTGWDVATKQAIVGTATSSGSAGVSSLGASLQVSKVKKSGAGGVKALSIPRPVADQAEAERLATGIVNRRESDMLRARGRIIPNPQVVPGAKLKLEGLAGDWNGIYYCTEVEHVWGLGSFDTYFEVGSTEPDSLVDLLGGSSTPTLDRLLGGLTVGIVTDNDDPKSLNRVKLKLPYLADDQQTGWARVLQPGAGKERGWNVVPEIDDEVLVGFEHGDIDRPYVLGGLFNGKDKPKYPKSELVKNGKVDARVMNSRLGHEIRLADGSGKPEQFVKLVTAGAEAQLFLGAEKIDLEANGIPVKVFNAQGSIEIAKNGDITMKTDGNIKLEAAKDVTIEGMNVNVKSKANVAVTAQAKLDLKANAPATLESTAITTVKGTLVKIN